MVKERSRNVTVNNWEKKKRVSAVENRDRSSRLRVNGEGGSTSRNIVGSSKRKNTAWKKDVKWNNERLDKLPEAITGLKKIIAQRGIVAQLSPVLLVTIGGKGGKRIGGRRLVE